MAILDNFTKFLQANQRPILGAAAGLLGASGSSTSPISTGQALGQGLLGFMGGQQEQQQMQARDLQIQQAQRQAEQEQARQASLQGIGGMLQGFQATGQPATQQEILAQALQSPGLGDQAFKGLLAQQGAGGQAKRFRPLLGVRDDEIVAMSPFGGVLEEMQKPEGVRLLKETPEQKRAADIIAKGAGKAAAVTAGRTAARQQDFISTGLEAADSMPNILRGIELLDAVKTGGLQSVALRAKQLFGVEGADEAELSSRLGKSILAQLRPIFGSQFTENEGRELKRIEAGFGKSTAGNRRLLKQTERIVRRSARRGIRAARRAGDLDSVREIEEALKFTLSPEVGGGAQARVGQELTAPTGQRVRIIRLSPDGDHEVEIIQ